MARLRSFLGRNGIPHQLLDPASDADARVFIERYAPQPEQLPLAVCPNGEVLRNPAENELAACIGMLDRDPADTVYDVAIAGAGPAGLAAAVYAGSEGLSVLMVDARAFGGQAGASARIENYFGFPSGLSGGDLTESGAIQAMRLGATINAPCAVISTQVEDDHFALTLTGGETVATRSVVVACGVRYRRLALAREK